MQQIIRLIYCCVQLWTETGQQGEQTEKTKQQHAGPGQRHSSKQGYDQL